MPEGHPRLTLLQNESSREEDRDQRQANLRQLLAPEVLALSGVFPVAPHIQPTVESESDRLERLRTLFWYLPPAAEAAELRQIYFQHAAWMYVHTSFVICLPYHYAAEN